MGMIHEPPPHLWSDDPTTVVSTQEARGIVGFTYKNDWAPCVGSAQGAPKAVIINEFKTDLFMKETIRPSDEKSYQIVQLREAVKLR
jgi:hypothetical protein